MLRLRILGDDWADVVKQESDWLLGLYKSWLWTHAGTVNVLLLLRLGLGHGGADTLQAETFVGVRVGEFDNGDGFLGVMKT